MADPKDGFLAPDVDDDWCVAPPEHKKLYRLCAEINRATHRVTERIAILEGDVRSLMAACVLGRMVDCYQSTVIISARGLGADGNVLGRVALEALYIAINLANTPGFTEKYVKADLLHRLKMANVIRYDKSNVFSPEVAKGVTDSFIAALKKEADNEGAETMSTESLAKAAGLEATYQHAYRILSADVHVTARSLSKYLVFDESGSLTALSADPKHDDTTMLLVPSSHSSVPVYPVLISF